LLARCEEGVGSCLKQIRGNLRDREWLGALWELIVIDGALQLGQVKYEPRAPGGRTPDILLEAYGDTRMWIEAAFLRVPRETPPRELQKHPVWSSLKGKAKQAAHAKVADPYVVFLATDRVHELESRSLGRGLYPEDAVRDVFRTSSSLSALVSVPILIRPEPFTGLERRPTAQLFDNAIARNPLSKYALNLLNRFDFNRWQFDLMTHPDVVRRFLRDFLKEHCERGFTPPPVDPSLLPRDYGTLPSPCWAYFWRFNQLRIARLGKDYWLLNGDSLESRAKSAEEAAESASFLYQPFPGHVLGPDGIEPDPDPGVPADLRQWTLEVPNRLS